MRCASLYSSCAHATCMWCREASRWQPSCHAGATDLYLIQYLCISIVWCQSNHTSVRQQYQCRSDERLAEVRPLTDPASHLPFVAETLHALRAEVGDAATTLGFIGAPWTLAAYAVEGRADRWAFPAPLPLGCKLIILLQEAC